MGSISGREDGGVTTFTNREIPFLARRESPLVCLTQMRLKDLVVNLSLNIHYYLIDSILYFKERRPEVRSWPPSPSSSTSTKLREKVRETGLWAQLTRVRRQLRSRNSQQSEHLIHPEHYTEEDQEDNMITRFKNIFSKNI